MIKCEDVLILILMMISSVLLTVMSVDCVEAWGGPHGGITKAALEVLPEWEREIWKDQIPQLIKEYCYIPDLVYSRKDLAPYAMMDDKPGLVYNLHLHLPDTQKENLKIIQYYFKKVVEAFKGNQLDEAAKYAGTLAHVIEDWGCPAHSVPDDNMFTLFKQFLPPPESHKYVLLHGPIEQGNLTFDISGYEPGLIGTSVSEAAYNLLGECNDVIINARGQVIPIIQGLYNNDQEAVIKGQLAAATHDARVLADAIHTAFCVAYGRLDPKAVDALKTLYLSDIVPLEATNLAVPQSSFFGKPYWGFPRSNVIFGKEGQPFPLTLKVPESGELIEKQFKQGIGSGTNSVLSYIVPEGVFQKFEALVGLHSQLGEKGCVIFQVKGDGDLMFDSGPIMGDAPARKISVSVVGVKEINLITKAGSRESNSNYAVWGELKLVKD